MSNPFDALTNEDNEKFYTHLLHIWEITPKEVQDRFRREQNCLLCHECKGYISSVQKAIREAKAAKYQVTMDTGGNQDIA